MLTNSNKSLFWEVKALAEKLDCSFAFDYVCFPCGNNSQNIEQVSASEIIDIMKVDNKYVKTYFRKRYQNQYTSDNIFKCRIKNDSMFMSCDANISICPCMNHLKFLYKGDNLLQIVHQLKDLLNIKFQNNSKCRECHLINICRYCPGKFYMATGSYENPPQWFCDFGELVYKNFIEEAVEIRKTNQKC